jgi:hypothetical protein
MPLFLQMLVKQLYLEVSGVLQFAVKKEFKIRRNEDIPLRLMYHIHLLQSQECDYESQNTNSKSKTKIKHSHHASQDGRIRWKRPHSRRHAARHVKR